MLRRVVALGACLAGLVCGVRAETVVLASAGKPVAQIVIPAKAAAPIQAAARDLQHYARRLCQVELPLRQDGRRVEGTGLYIGPCEPCAEADLPPEDLTPEASAIRVRDGNILFCSRWPTPAAFAVYGFIEATLGVRWFAPGALWEVVPAGMAGELVLEVDEVLHVPSTSPRIWSGHAWNDD